jgi:chromosome segregation ATPase
MVADQNHSSDISSEQERQAERVNRRTEKIAQTLGLDEQNAEMYSALFGENKALKKQLDDYHSEYISLKRTVKRLERDVKSLETELEDLDECVDRDTVVDLIHEIVPSLINEKGKGFSYLSETSEKSDSVETYVVKQRRKGSQRDQARPRKVKILRSG